MTWTTLSYSFGSKLTSTKMTQNQDNFTALAQAQAGAPAILAVAGGSLVLTSKMVLSAQATAVFALAGYDHVLVFMRDILPTPNNQVGLWLRLSTDGGGTYYSTNNDYAWSVDGFGSSSTVAQGASAGVANRVELTGGANANYDADGQAGISGAILFTNPNAGGTRSKNVTFDSRFFSAANEHFNISGTSALISAGGKAAALTHAQILFAAGNIASGQLSIYGVKTA